MATNKLGALQEMREEAPRYRRAGVGIKLPLSCCGERIMVRSVNGKGIIKVSGKL